MIVSKKALKKQAIKEKKKTQELGLGGSSEGCLVSRRSSLKNKEPFLYGRYNEKDETFSIYFSEFECYKKSFSNEEELDRMCSSLTLLKTWNSDQFEYSIVKSNDGYGYSGSLKDNRMKILQFFRLIPKPKEKNEFIISFIMAGMTFETNEKYLFERNHICLNRSGDLFANAIRENISFSEDIQNEIEKMISDVTQ